MFSTFGHRKINLIKTVKIKDLNQIFEFVEQQKYL